MTTSIKMCLFSALAFLGSIAMAPDAAAQNTGGVFGPEVTEGHKSIQYRGAINPDNAIDQFGFAQRLHYQQAIDGDFMWRIIGATRKTDASDFDFDFLQAELFWELSDDEDKHKTGLRFDARLTDGDRAEQLGLNWMNHFNFDNGWHARALVLTNVQIGDTAADGINVQTRGRVGKKLDSGPILGVELYSNYGQTSNISRFSDQSHTIGPFIEAPIAKKLSLFAGPLFGLTGASPDVEARLWFTRGF
ncbi:hypothetical protein N9M10_03525 [Hellea sp.]|nr:hypothetical protein [Hellea sp.]